jgi:hypothetical protein
MYMEKYTYNARVTIRTKNPTSYCINIPKKMVMESLPLGTHLEITLKKVSAAEVSE